MVGFNVVICCERFLLNSSVSAHCQQRCSHCGEEGPEELQQLCFSGVWGQDPRRQPGGKGAARSEPQPRKNLFQTFHTTVEIYLPCCSVQSTSAILMENMDLYMLNPCSNKIWYFTVWLRPLRHRVLSFWPRVSPSALALLPQVHHWALWARPGEAVGHCQLWAFLLNSQRLPGFHQWSVWAPPPGQFSSNSHQTEGLPGIFLGCQYTFVMTWNSAHPRYPTNKWQKLGTFHARDERTVQSFPLDEHLYAKYVKVSRFIPCGVTMCHTVCRHPPESHSSRFWELAAWIFSAFHLFPSLGSHKVCVILDNVLWKSVKWDCLAGILVASWLIYCIEVKRNSPLVLFWMHLYIALNLSLFLCLLASDVHQVHKG